MTHHHEEASVLQVEVGVGIDDGSISRFHPIVVARGSHFLLGILSDGRAVVGRVIRGEEAGIGTEIDAQHAGNLESQEKIGVNVQVGHGNRVLIRRFLVGDDAFPVERTEREILRERGRQHCDGIAILPHADRVVCASEILGDAV